MINSGQITSGAFIALAGTAESGSTVNIYKGLNLTFIGSGVSDSMGIFSIDVPLSV